MKSGISKLLIIPLYIYRQKWMSQGKNYQTSHPNLWAPRGEEWGMVKHRGTLFIKHPPEKISVLRYYYCYCWTELPSQWNHASSSHCCLNSHYKIKQKGFWGKTRSNENSRVTDYVKALSIIFWFVSKIFEKIIWVKNQKYMGLKRQWP